MQAVPVGKNVWAVRVHNGTGGPITDLAVDVYAIDDAGNRVQEPCTPAKDQIPMAEFMRQVLGQFLQGGMGAVADRAAAQSGFGYGQVISPGALEMMRGTMIPNTMAGALSPKLQGIVQAQMKDSFPALLTAGNEESVLYSTGEGLSVQADIRFADEDGTHWVRPFGQLPKPAE
ncbi:hypothetical protein APR11_004766 [Nocardia amikacinitolerans]|nr:hypothetical protein [Nocardia amikacinitolerans]